jgi:phosphatidate cytidylyltransferase
MLKQLNNLQQRITIGGTGSLLLLLFIYYSHSSLLNYLFVAFIAGVIALSLSEYYQIARAKGFLPLSKLGIITTIAYVIAIYFCTQTLQAQLIPKIILGLSGVMAFLYYFWKGSQPLMNLAITFFGMLYLTIPLSYLIEINYFEAPPFVSDGRYCLIYLLIVTKITDTGAFFIGKLLGHTKLSPYISPKKTWEGAIGGSLTALFAGIALVLFFRYGFDTPPMQLSWSQAIWLPLGLSIVAQWGDLAESLLKRDAGVKDSSTYFLGLGGMLDVVDSLIFTAPLLYFFLIFQVV